MPWDIDTLNEVFDKTDGYCRYCGKQLAWKNHGQPGNRGAWEVDHSIPKALGGTDYLNNLWPACYDCNHDKGTLTGRQFMAQYQPTRTRRDQGSGLGWLLLGLIAIGVASAMSNSSKSKAF